MNRDILKRLTEPALVAIRCDGADWPRGLVADAPIPDAWMGLVEQRDGRRRLVSAGQNPRADRGDRLLLVRNRPITVPLTLHDAAAACGNTVDAHCELLVRWEARDHDLAALGRSILDAQELTLDQLAQRIADGGGRAAVHEFVRTRHAESLLGGDLRDDLLTALREQLKRLGFEAGFAIASVAKLDFTSMMFMRRQAAARQAAERVERIQSGELVERAALVAAQRRLEDLSGLFTKLRAAAGESGSQDAGRWHELLPALSPLDRGRLLENLWRLTPDVKRAAAFVAVTEDAIVWVDPQDITGRGTQSPAAAQGLQRQLRISDEVGGLRSVTFDAERGWLLVGAACGVLALNAADGKIANRFTVPAAGRPTTGFNSAVILGDRLIATHSQLGCWSWSLAGGEPTALLRPASGGPRTVRAATATLDGRLLFAVDDCVHVCDAGGATARQLSTGGSVVHAIAVLDQSVYVATARGLLLRDRLDGTQDVWEVVHRAAEPIESVQVRRWNDLVELVVPAGSAGALGVYPDEGFSTCLLASTTPVRRVWACDDAIVALNDRRDRLIIATADHPGRAGREAPLAQRTGGLVQDVCIVTAPVGGSPAAAV